jgi:hypothetical protein
MHGPCEIQRELAKRRIMCHPGDLLEHTMKVTRRQIRLGCELLQSRSSTARFHGVDWSSRHVTPLLQLSFHHRHRAVEDLDCRSSQPRRILQKQGITLSRNVHIIRLFASSRCISHGPCILEWSLPGTARRYDHTGQRFHHGRSY